jgi:4-hydroxybenzoate polyprenyltransferase
MTPDAAPGLVERLPTRWRPWARLARLDRPVGAWLLYLPCLWGLFLAGRGQWEWVVLFAVGAVAMRSAGCVWNDIIDRDLDRRVARTAARPVASGAISVPAARRFMLALVAVGFGVWLLLGPLARLVALASLVLVALYPFMKRITWWPQAWLGLTFNWGVLVAAAQATGTVPAWAIALYAAGVAWTLAYDTIYALQDIEDDALAGVRSSARALGPHVRAGVQLFGALSAGLLALALWLRLPDPLAPLASLPFALHLAWQAMALRPDDPSRALALFRSNRTAGLLAAAACLVVGLAAV